MNKKYECVFLDRDGTINIDPGYISNVNDFKFYSYTFKALKILKSLTNFFIIITNQSGVSRGIIEKKELLKINSFIQSQFLKNNLNLLDIYYCTDLPKNASKFRKPGVGMFLKASKKHNLKLQKCMMIGDSYKDIIPANKLGMDSMLVLTGNGRADLNKFDNLNKPDYLADNLYSGVKELIN